MDGFKIVDRDFCWICRREDEEENFIFDDEFDAFVHPQCLKNTESKDLLDHETK